MLHFKMRKCNISLAALDRQRGGLTVGRNTLLALHPATITPNRSNFALTAFEKPGR